MVRQPIPPAPSPSPLRLPVAIGAYLALALSAGARGAEVVESRGSFQCQGKAIAVDRFEPSGPGRHPAVLVIHGSDGLRQAAGGTGPYHDLARALARRGYVAHVVHYFDRTGHASAEMAEIRRHFASWGTTIAEAVTSLTAQPNVDAARVGLVGFSLGAYLSLSEAMFDRRVAAVVDYFGGLPEVLAKSLNRMPPTLILHGDADPVVSVEEARILERLLREKKIAHEVRIYPGQGHGFRGAEQRDAEERTFRFLETHVARSASAQFTRATTTPCSLGCRLPACLPGTRSLGLQGSSPAG